MVKHNPQRTELLAALGITERDVKPDGWAQPQLDAAELIDLAQLRLLEIFSPPIQEMIAEMLLQHNYASVLGMLQRLLEDDPNDPYLKKAVLLADFLVKKVGRA